jgi:tRNA threonylcarbamoyladenosine biosynthesis protein TsaE
VTTAVICRSPQETQAAGESLGARLGPGAVVACIGELGAGKTCFLQGLCRGLGVVSDVTSPTFVLVNQYRGRLPVYHLDAYRTGSLTELVDLGLEEMLYGRGVTVIEWADKLLPLLPPHAIAVTITGLGDEPRSIVIADPASVDRRTVPAPRPAR